MAVPPALDSLTPHFHHADRTPNLAGSGIACGSCQSRTLHDAQGSICFSGIRAWWGRRSIQFPSWRTRFSSRRGPPLTYSTAGQAHVSRETRVLTSMRSRHGRRARRGHGTVRRPGLGRLDHTAPETARVTVRTCGKRLVGFRRVRPPRTADGRRCDRAPRRI